MPNLPILIPIGRVTRARGLAGEVEIAVANDAFVDGSGDTFFLRLDGIDVPFRCRDWRFKNQDTAIFAFDEVSDEAHARTLAGALVSYPLNEIDHTAGASEEQFSLPSLRALTGFTVETHEGQLLGRVTEVDDSTANVLLYIETPAGSEVTVPYHDDLLEDFDLTLRLLRLHIPDGLLSL